MSDYLQRFLPEYDENEMRERLAGSSAEDLLEMVIRAYKEKRLILKMLDESETKLKKIQEILKERSSLLDMPGVPNSDDIGRMTE